MRNILFCALLMLACSREGYMQEYTDLEDTTSNDLRLPQNLHPNHYLVRLQPFLSGDFSVDGYVEITFDVQEATDKIVLHINDIITNNDTVKVYKMTDADRLIPIVSQSYDPDRQFYTAQLGEQLQQSAIYVISINFTGYLNEDLVGFYRSSYKDDDGNTVWLAATQFEPTDARRAFPCFDEPAFKAKFTIEIARPEALRTISNMPRAEEVPVDGQDGWVWDKFNTSVPMSSYLVAFVVSDFEHVDSVKEPNSDYIFRIWARKNSIPLSDYSMKVGPKVSKFYEDFFEVPFPLPKQDMVALPDFSAGAMENWGIITFREARLMSSPLLTNAYDRMKIGTIISHELAHMWFGDLVSPSWWTDLWLNEGFASYMEYLGFNHFDPSMKLLDQILINDHHPAFLLDCLETSHPIRQTVHNPDQINELFDTISYKKGASILRMISNVLTEETFRKALHNYLTELSYSNAEQDDLWRYLTEQAHNDGTLDSDITVKDIMDTWTLQMGYPVVNVIKNEDGTVKVSQQRFLLVNSTNEDSHDYKWWIPLSYTSSSVHNFEDTKPQKWMKNTEAEIVLNDVVGVDDEWYVVNIGEVGFFRVNYNEDNWNAIAKQLMEDHTVIGILNRAQIVDDAFNLARGGQLSYNTALKILGYIKKEEEFVPLKTALNNIKYIRDMLSQGENDEHFKKLLQTLIVPLYETIGFDDDLSSPHLEQRKRTELVAVACQIGYQPCIDASVELYKKWMANPTDLTIISPNVKSTVLCTAIGAGGDDEWQFAWDQYESVDIAKEKVIILNALGCSKDADTLNKFLTRAITPGEGIRKQDTEDAIVSVAKNDEVGQALAWQFLQDQWLNLVKYFGSVSFTLKDIVSGITENLRTQEQLDQLKSFREKYEGNFVAAERAVDQAVENVQNNLNWVDNYLPIIRAWIQETIRQKELENSA